MRKKLIYNYWLIIVSWCLFLNKNTLLAMILGFCASALLLSIKRKVNFWRVMSISLTSYMIISFVLSTTNILYFFPKLSYFNATICLNLALTNERLYLFKRKYLVSFLLSMVIGVSILSIISLLLPNNLYTIFTKNSLFLMILLIFLPYIALILYCMEYKSIKEKVHKSPFQNKDISVC